MSYMTKEAIMKRLQEHYDEASKQGEVFAVFLQGSQNYINDLFSESSDVDSRAIYIPDQRDILLGKDISKPELVLSNEEHIDRFDVRKYVSLLKKPGINNYESLFSEYVIINEDYREFYERLIDNREGVARSNQKSFLMATMGISRKDMAALQKRSGGEDYDIDNYGYSRKRLSNIMRFNSTVKAYIEGKGFSDCLRSMDQQLIHDVRRTSKYTLEEALEIVAEMDKETYTLAKGFTGKSDASALDKLDDILADLLATRFK